eukprot:Plantae.Rhodophyta-Rhodochaete_pulchella.ctg1426.p1 GENE.Plantae.Rhodophyta-Rhodochaete_pulchella.ctg1426~~Plantae.Rhodophyta-Rhodochaete_pulchella.ctg1426.p1  ORF type:complete len:227 (+),score=30.72 Plantae.Rhodophyta-Rhodochaete_pulchella.ctg1426:27-683(+)
MDIAVNGVNVGRMVFGLFGRDAPDTVASFLSYFPEHSSAVASGIDDEGFGASYRRSQFYRKSAGRLLEGGRIRNLQSVVLNRDEVYFEYFGKLTKAAPQLENNNLHHDQRGLLTRELLHLGPEFAITLGPRRDLDGTHIVFGVLLQGHDVLDRLDELPVRTDRSMEPEGSLADNVFRFQKRFFLKLGQDVFKDQRALETYPDKLLRRVDVTTCGIVRK